MDSAEPTAPTGPDGLPHPPRKPRRLPDIHPQRCTGCGRCVAACDQHLLSLDAVGWVKVSVLHQPDRCTGCSACAVTCPFEAITMRRPD
jgi:ferredoxin